LTYYVSAIDALYGPLKATKAYRRMTLEAKRAPWVEMLRKGHSWTVVAEAGEDVELTRMVLERRGEVAVEVDLEALAI
jgi:hypothetical protein